VSQDLIVVYSVIFQRPMPFVRIIPLAPQVTETPLQDVIHFNDDFQAELFFLTFIAFRVCFIINDSAGQHFDSSVPVVTWQTLVPTYLYYP